MNKKGMKKKTETDLRKELREKREDLRQFRFNISGGKTRDVKYGAKVKKEIARILTELNARKGMSKIENP